MEKNIKDISKRPELVQSDWVQSGVAILMDPNNGRILAMVSIPSYDPNTLNRDFKEQLCIKNSLKTNLSHSRATRP